MIFRNFRLIFPDRIENGSLQIRDGKIISVNGPFIEDDEVIDGEGKYLSPGFIDIHIHGAGGKDTMDGEVESINTIAGVIAEHGTTSFLPTTMTMGVPEIRKALASIMEAAKNPIGASILGVHLEGPFISPKAIGAQNPGFVLEPSIEAYESITDGYEDLVTSITMAPEVPGASELIPYLKQKGVRVSIGHTAATYDEAIVGIGLGCSHSTHLFNAMTPLTHRSPGTVGAIFDTDITTETISDGIHISWPSLRIAYRQKTSDKVMLVTDAMMACGMPDGKYWLGGQEVLTKDGAARLLNGSLAGSILTMDAAVRNVARNTSLPLYEVVKMASLNGARFCGADDRKGKIAEGYDADLLVFDEDVNISHVFIEGRKFK